MADSDVGIECKELVTNISNQSPTSQTCRQHISSPTSVTNIDVAKMLTILEKHENFVSNSEWDWKNYSYRIENVTSLVRNGLTFSQLILDFEVKRNEPFYAMTLFVPMLILTSLAPVGLILPGKSTIPSDLILK